MPNADACLVDSSVEGHIWAVGATGHIAVLVEKHDSHAGNPHMWGNQSGQGVTNLTS